MLALVLLVLAPGCGRESHSLPYDDTTYDADDAVRAFANAGITLKQRARSDYVTTFGDRRNVLEVDVWGPPDLVENTGFHDLTWERDCRSVARDAGFWESNVRVVVDCRRAGRAGQEWVARAMSAIAQLGRPAPTTEYCIESTVGLPPEPLAPSRPPVVVEGGCVSVAR